MRHRFDFMAYSLARQDDDTERAMYRKVLALLRAERGKFDRGLTGSRTHDKELEKNIAILLSDE